MSRSIAALLGERVRQESAEEAAREKVRKVWTKKKPKPPGSRYLGGKASPLLVMLTPECRAALRMIQAAWVRGPEKWWGAFGEKDAEGRRVPAAAEIIRALVLAEGRRVGEGERGVLPGEGERVR